MTKTSLFFHVPFIVDLKGYHVCIGSPSFWLNVPRYYPNWQPLLDIGLFHHSTNECFLGSIIVTNNVLYPTSYSFVLGVLDMIYYILFLECEITSHHSTMAIFFILHFVELQLDFVISTNFKSPCNPCSSLFYHSSLKLFFGYRLKLLQLFCSYLNLDIFSPNLNL